MTYPQQQQPYYPQPQQQPQQQGLAQGFQQPQQQPDYTQQQQYYAPPPPQQQQYAPQQQVYAPPPPPTPREYYTAPPPPPQAPAQPLPPVGLDDWYSQPSVGWGPAWSFRDELPIGTYYVGTVARALTDADVDVRTDDKGVVQTFKGGRTQTILKIPMFNLEVPEPDKYPDGRGVWWCGFERDELARAQSAVGADPSKPPEEGATIKVTKSGRYRNKRGTWSARFTVQYWRPQGAAPVQQPQTQPVTEPVPAQVAQPPAQVAQPPAQAPVGQAQPPQQAPPVTSGNPAPIQQTPDPTQQLQAVPSNVTPDVLNDPIKRQLLEQATGLKYNWPPLPQG